MEQTHTLLLEALGAALKNEAVQCAQPMEPEQWAALLQLADKHRVMSMIYQAAYCCPSPGRSALRPTGRRQRTGRTTAPPTP